MNHKIPFHNVHHTYNVRKCAGGTYVMASFRSYFGWPLDTTNADPAALQKVGRPLYGYSMHGRMLVWV